MAGSMEVFSWKSVLSSGVWVCACLGWPYGLWGHLCLAWASTQSQWLLLTVLPSVRSFWRHSVLQLARSSRRIPKLTANTRERDAAWFLCRRWWQGPCWVLGNASASNDFPCPGSPHHLEWGSSFWELLGVEGPGFVLRAGGRALPMSPHCGLQSSLEEFCQQNEADCPSRQCFYQ